MPVILLAALAHADDLVLTADDASVAIARVSADAGRPVWELRPGRLSALLSGDRARVVGAGQPAPCTGAPVTNAALREAVASAEKHVVRLEWAEARQKLDGAATSLGCLGEPAEASLASRLFFLSGLARREEGDDAGARAAFARAIFFSPGLAWDEKFPPAGRSTFDLAARQLEGTPRLPLRFGPGLEGVTNVWADGRPAVVEGGTLVLPAGVHLVQLLQPEVRTFEVDLASERPVVVMVPAKLQDSALATLPGSPLLDAVVDEALGADVTVYVWTGSRTWRGTATGWEELPVSDAAQAQSRARKRERTRTALVASGVTALAAGGVAGVVGALGYAGNLDCTGFSDGIDQGRCAGTGVTDRSWAVAGGALAGAGLAMGAAGLALGPGDGGATLLAGPTHVAFAWRF